VIVIIISIEAYYLLFFVL